MSRQISVSESARDATPAWVVDLLGTPEQGLVVDNGRERLTEIREEIEKRDFVYSMFFGCATDKWLFRRYYYLINATIELVLNMIVPHLDAGNSLLTSIPRFVMPGNWNIEIWRAMLSTIEPGESSDRAINEFLHRYPPVIPENSKKHIEDFVYLVLLLFVPKFLGLFAPGMPNPDLRVASHSSFLRYLFNTKAVNYTCMRTRFHQMIRGEAPSASDSNSLIYAEASKMLERQGRGSSLHANVITLERFIWDAYSNYLFVAFASDVYEEQRNEALAQEWSDNTNDIEAHVLQAGIQYEQ